MADDANIKARLRWYDNLAWLGLVPPADELTDGEKVAVAAELKQWGMAVIHTPDERLDDDGIEWFIRKYEQAVERGWRLGAHDPRSP